MIHKTHSQDRAVASATSCTFQREAGRFVITVSGDLDLAAAEGSALGGALSHYRSDEPLDVVLDLQDVPFVDSTGLSWLMAVRSAAALANRRVRIRASSAAVDTVLDLAQLSRYFPAESPPVAEPAVEVRS